MGSIPQSLHRCNTKLCMPAEIFMHVTGARTLRALNRYSDTNSIFVICETYNRMVALLGSRSFVKH